MIFAIYYSFYNKNQRQHSVLFMRRERTNKFSLKKTKMNPHITSLDQSMNACNRTRSFLAQQEDQLIQASVLSQKTQEDSQKMSEIVHKLISKNKINSKNAFNVPLVDINNLRSYQSNDDGAWSIYSSVLEGSAKVYGYRVDGMSENINLLSQSIIRNIKIQNQESGNVQQKNKQIKSHNLNKSIDFKDFNIQMHIDKQKIQQESFIQSRTNSCHHKIRRLMDQNGISGLVLGTVPIGSDLSIGIYNQYFSIKKNQFLGDEQEKIQVRNTNLQFRISKQIQNLCNVSIFMGNSKNRVNQNYSMSELDYVLEQFQNLHCQRKEEQQQTEVQQLQNLQQTMICYLSEVDVHLIRQSDNELINMKKKKNKSPVTNKLVKTKSKKKSNQQNSHEYIAHLPFIELNKSQIIEVNAKKASKQRRKPQRARVKDNILAVDLCVSRDYLKDNKFINASFPQKVTQEKAQQISYMKTPNQHNQHLYENANIFDLSTLQQNYGQNYDQNEENDQKCRSIKQNKLQLNKLLQKIEQNQIKFSQLHHLHQQMTYSSNQAIDFLTVLHLANELNLTLLQINFFDFFIQC